MCTPIDERVDAELVKRAYDLLPVGLLGTTINSSVIMWLHWHIVPNKILLSWFLCLLFTTLVRVAMLFRFHRRSRTGTSGKHWKLFFNAGIAVSGALWGLSAFFLLFHNSLPHEILVVFVLGGMAAGAAATFSFLLPSYYLYAIPALAPQTIEFLVIGDPMRVALAGMLVFFFLLISVPAEQNAQITRSDFHLRFEREEMLTVLSREKERTDSAYQELQNETVGREHAQRELKAAHAGLERTVLERTADLARINAELRHQIRERESAEQALRRSEELYRTMVETARRVFGLLAPTAAYGTRTAAWPSFWGGMQRILWVQTWSVLSDTGIPNSMRANSRREFVK